MKRGVCCALRERGASGCSHAAAIPVKILRLVLAESLGLVCVAMTTSKPDISAPDVGLEVPS